MGSANKKIVLDTNMLLAVEQFRVDVIQEVRKMMGNQVELNITENIQRELVEKEGAAGSTGKRAKVALELVEKAGIKALPSRVRDTDKELVSLAREGYIIATNDRELRKRVKKHGGSSILLRQRKYLVLDAAGGGF